MKWEFGDEKGSEMSGDWMEGLSGGAEVVGVKGGRERRRMASRMVGWKGPPWGSLWRRWVGRVWPKTKKVDIGLLCKAC